MSLSVCISNRLPGGDASAVRSGEVAQQPRGLQLGRCQALLSADCARSVFSSVVKRPS